MPFKLPFSGGHHSGSQTEQTANQNFQAGHSIDPNTGQLLGTPGTVPANLALQFQDAHEQAVWGYRQRLMSGATDYLQGAAGNLQRFRPGGAAAMESGIYQGVAGNMMQQAAQTQPMNLLRDYERQAGVDARRQMRNASYTQAAATLAGAAIGAFAGPGGAAVGANIGSQVGGAAAGVNAQGGSGNQPYGPPQPGTGQAMLNPQGGVGNQPYGPAGPGMQQPFMSGNTLWQDNPEQWPGQQYGPPQPQGGQQETPEQEFQRRWPGLNNMMDPGFRFGGQASPGQSSAGPGGTGSSQQRQSGSGGGANTGQGTTGAAAGPSDPTAGAQQLLVMSHMADMMEHDIGLKQISSAIDTEVMLRAYGRAA
jgi:hypothetical protein